MADIVDAPAQTSRLAQLRQNEQHWIWKAGMRAFLVIIDIVAIGCAAWLIASAAGRNNEEDALYYGYDAFPGTSVGAIIVLCVAFVWCILCLVIPFTLKPVRPIHPGVPVGIDLILWLSYIVVALFSTAAILNIIYYGSGGFIEDPSYGSNGYDGEYVLYPNNTWIYNVTSVYGSEYYNFTSGQYQYPSPNLSSVTRDCSPEFTSCAAQDAYINQLWHEKPTIEGTDVVVAAVTWLGVLFHFILFVWACVDTHRVNARKRVGAEQLVADRIIQDLEKRGFIQTRNGVVVAAGAAPNNATPNAAATEPLLLPNPVASREDVDAITPR